MHKGLWQCILVALLVVSVRGDYGYEGDDYDDYDDSFASPPKSSKSSSAMPFIVEHSFSGFEDDFKERLRLDVKMAHYSGKPTVKVTHSTKLTEGQVRQLQTLVENESYYRIRMRPLSADSQDEYVGAAVPACRLIASDFMDDLALHLDANGAAIGLEYHTAVPPGKTEYCDRNLVINDLASVNAGKTFKTGAYIVIPQPVSTVPNAPPSKSSGPQANSFPPLPPPMGVHAVKDPSQTGPGGQPQEQQSFLRRYAYIIIPLVLILMLNGGEDPEGGAAGGAGGQRGARGGGSSGGARRR